MITKHDPVIADLNRRLAEVDAIELYAEEVDNRVVEFTDALEELLKEHGLSFTAIQAKTRNKSAKREPLTEAIIEHIAEVFDRETLLRLEGISADHFTDKLEWD